MRPHGNSENGPGASSRELAQNPSRPKGIEPLPPRRIAAQVQMPLSPLSRADENLADAVTYSSFPRKRESSVF